jgi:two-component system chemotaxis response regulator CheB
VCPICEGALTEVHPGVFTHFRCHVGHSFTLDTLVREQGNELERVLWAAVRALEESAALAARMAATEKGPLRKRFLENEQAHRRNAEQLRQLLLHASATAVDPDD